MFPKIRPEIIVLSSDVLNCGLSDAESALNSEFPIYSKIIDNESALAIWGHDVNIMADGSHPDHKGPHPLHIGLNRFIKDSAFPLNGGFPSSRFFATFLFPGREEPYRMITRSLMDQGQPLRLRLHTYKDLKEGFAKVREVFLEWLGVATTVGFNDEILSCTVESMERYSKPEESPWPRQLGWEIIMPRCNEVFFSWLELFFRLRRQLPTSMRVALDFSHP